MPLRSGALALSVVGVVSLVSAIATAGLISGGTRSGTVHVDGGGSNSGTDGTHFNLTSPVPATDPGNVSVSGSGTSFPTSGNICGATSSVNLGTVSDNYSLDASASLYYTYVGSSGHNNIALSFSFSQEIIVTEPVNYQLTLTGTRTDRENLGDDSNNNSGYSSTVPPKISFTGPGGVNDSVFAPFFTHPPQPPGPLTETQNFFGVLQPGTYTFTGSYSSAGGNGTGWNFSFQNGTLPTQTLGVTAQLTVTALPEPSTTAALLPSLALLRRRRV